MTRITPTKTALASDASKAINSAIAGAANGSIIVIQDGKWPCHGPIELWDKNFILQAEGAILRPSDKYVVSDKPFFTYGMNEPDKYKGRRQRINGLSIDCGSKIHTPAVALRSHNAYGSILNDICVTGFDIGIQEWATADGYSYWNVLNNCQSACRTAFQQTGIPHPEWGLQCTCTKINGFIGEWLADMTCCFDLQGAYNSIKQAATEGPALKDLVKISGFGWNDIEFSYFEGDYPLRATSTAKNASILRIYNRANHPEWLTVIGNITQV